MASDALVARHGDSWVSPPWAVVLGGAPTDLSAWFIRAQARQTSEADVVFEWSVAAGTLLLGSATVQLADGSMITTGTVQLRIRPGDWAGKPRTWKGVLDVELSSDGTDSPAERHTVIADRKIQVVPDVARA